jgi:acyl-CoA hydrolase
MTRTDLAPKPPRVSHATMTELMMPNMANSLGNVFGGVILSLVDRVAAVSAIRHARGPCVTVSVDRVDFREPIHVSELVTARANSCYLTFVAIDEQGRPTLVPPLSPETAEENQRYAAAERRRAERMREQLRERKP